MVSDAFPDAEVFESDLTGLKPAAFNGIVKNRENHFNMAKYGCALLSLVSVLHLSTAARTVPEDSPIKKDTTGVFITWARKIRYKTFVSSVTIENRQWTRLCIRPDFPIGRFGVAPELELFLDDKWNFSDKGYSFNSRKETLESLARRIYYVRYNNPGDDLYLKAGGLENVTLGYGFLVNNYSNSLEFPEIKKLGVQFEAKSLGNYDITIQSFMNNIGEIYVWGPLTGLRTALKVLKPHTASGTILHDLEIGVTGAADFNQNQGIGPVDSVYRQKTDPDGFYMVGAEATLPIWKRPGLNLAIYGEAAKSLDDRDSGTEAGGYGFSFPGFLLTSETICANINFCRFKDRFCSEYFNLLYEFERHRIIGPEPFVKDEFIDSVNHIGVSAKLSWDIRGFVRFKGSGQFLFGDSFAYDRLGLVIGLGRKILKYPALLSGGRVNIVSVDAFYHKNRIGGFDKNAWKRKLFPAAPEYRPQVRDRYFEVTPFTLFGLASRMELARWFGMNVGITRYFLLETFTGDVKKFDRINIEPYFQF